jgi:carboxypeptidase Taq
MSRQRDHAIATPVSLISRLARATSLAKVRWVEAREKNDFNLFAPHLEEVLHLVRDRATLLGQALNLAPYDALLDGFTPGLRMVELDSIFRALSRRLPTLIRETMGSRRQRRRCRSAAGSPAAAAPADRRGHEGRGLSV